MSRVSTADLSAVLEQNRERLRALTEIQPREAQPVVMAPEPRGVRRAYGLDRAMLILGRAASRKRYGRLGLLATVVAANANPKWPKANIAAGVGCGRANDADRALLYLRRAAAHDDSSRRGNWELAKFLLRETPDYEADQELLSALRQASKSPDHLIHHAASVALSDVLNHRGAHPEAEAAAQAVLSTKPKDARALRAKANSLVPQNRFAEAASLYRKLLAQEPGSIEIAQKLRMLTQLAEEQRLATVPSGERTSAGKEPLLIGVGAGIGDIVHATPMIRNVARRTGAPVEVVVAADHPGAEFLVTNPQYVSRVWKVSGSVLERPYQTVFLTNFFSPLRFAFNADRVVMSAEWRKFRTGMLNDTLFNLEAAKQLLGIPWDEADAQHYFVGDLAWRPPSERLIGMHAGSKSGRWLSKRWPYFAALAARVSARSIRVASFGTPDEYVPGTENRTGGTIQEMSSAMLACTHFVSNDSGGMHIASALGIPTLAIYAPTDALTHLPLRRETAAVMLTKECSPCEVKNHRHFASGMCRCIADVSLEAVEAKVLEMLAGATAPVRGEPAAQFSEGAV